MSEPRYQWAAILELDDAGDELCRHVMPVDTHVTFATREEAQAFFDRIEAEGEPCVTDEDGMITGSYFGHVLSKDCVCSPTVQTAEDSVTPIFVHNREQ